MTRIPEKAPDKYDKSWAQRVLDWISNLHTSQQTLSKTVTEVETNVSKISAPPSGAVSPGAAPPAPPVRAVPKPGNLTYSLIDPPTLPPGIAMPHLGKIAIIEWDRIYDTDFRNYEMEIYIPYNNTAAIKYSVNNPTDSSTTVKFYFQSPGNIDITFKVRVRTVFTDDKKSDWTVGGDDGSWNFSHDTVGPAPPTNCLAEPALRSIVVKWTNPSTSDFHQTNVYLNTANSFAGATKVTSKTGVGANCNVTLVAEVGWHYYVFLQATDNTGNVQTGTPNYTDVTQGNCVQPYGTSATIGTGEIITNMLTQASRQFSTDIIFSATAYNAIKWETSAGLNGTMYFFNGTTQSVTKGTLTLTANDYYYIYKNSASSVLVNTTNPSTYASDNYTLMAVARKYQGTGDTAKNYAFVIQVAGGANISADMIRCNQLSAISIDVGTLKAGILQNSDGTFKISLDDGTIISNKSITINSGGSIGVNSGGVLTIASDADINVNSGGDINVSSGANMNINSGGTITIASGGQVIVNAVKGLVLNSAQGMYVNEGGDITLEGDTSNPSSIRFIRKTGGTLIGSLRPFYDGVINSIMFSAGSDGVNALLLGEATTPARFRRIILSTKGDAISGDGVRFLVTNAAGTALGEFNIMAPTSRMPSFTFPWPTGSTKFLREDGTWQTVSGGGDVYKSGSPAANQVAFWTDGSHISGNSYFYYDTEYGHLVAPWLSASGHISAGGSVYSTGPYYAYSGGPIPGVSGTVTLAKLRVDGSNGSLTFIGGICTALTPPT
jgi:hypothetical protein